MADLTIIMSSKKESASEKVKRLQKEMETIDNCWKRARADYLNLERRTHQTITENIELGQTTLVTQLLPVLDSLEKAQAYEDTPSGISSIYNQLHTILSNLGLEEIESQGKQFDPITMEAVAAGNTGDFTEKKTNATIVTEVVEKGYRLKGKVIRPAKVIVG